MKIIESDPIIWGYKRGYSVDQIAEGLQIRRARVIDAISAYEERLAVHEVMLRTPLSKLGGNAKRFAIWQREVKGARAALDAIKAERHLQDIERSAA